jgi:hypothetical protein
MKADMRTFIYLFAIFLKLSEVISERWFDHIVVIDKGDNEVFLTQGIRYTCHNVGDNVFWTMIQVDQNGQVWANNPFPVCCTLKINQDTESLQGRRSLISSQKKPKTKVAKLKYQDGPSTTILMRYYLTEKQYKAAKRYTPPPGN